MKKLAVGILAHVDAGRDDIVGGDALYGRKHPENGPGGPGGRVSRYV